MTSTQSFERGTVRDMSLPDGLVVASYRFIGVRHFARFFAWKHLPEGKPREVAFELRKTAQAMVNKLPDNPELAAGLRKLMEAKDCFVRAALPEPPAETIEVPTHD